MSARPRLTSSDYAVLAQFRVALRHFLNFSAEAARRAGVSPVQHQALLAIKGLGVRRGRTVGEVAGHLDLKPNSAVGLINRLGRAGLIQRRVDAVDRRRVHVVLTPRGERILGRLSAAHRQELLRLRPALQELLDHIR